MLATGTLDSNAISTLLKSIPSETWELVTHPGYNDADLAAVHTRLRASRDVERQALLTLREFPEMDEMDLISFADLKGPS
jgi:hypothetical protein